MWDMVETPYMASVQGVWDMVETPYMASGSVGVTVVLLLVAIAMPLSLGERLPTLGECLLTEPFLPSAARSGDLRYQKLGERLLTEPSCNPEPTFWPAEIKGPPEWGIPCPAAVTDHTVYGRVTVYEDIPLEGAEVRVNRIVDGAQTGAGMAMSDANGDYRIEIAGHVDALRIYIIYPPGFEAWGVTAPVGSWGLELLHWPDPPAMCGPVHWKAAYETFITPEPTETRTSTPVPTQEPTETRTSTPVPTQEPTETRSVKYTVTPAPTLEPTETMSVKYTVTPTTTPAPFYLVVPPELRMTPAATSGERQEQIITIAVYAVNLLRLWTYIVAAVAGLSVAANVIKWKSGIR